MKKILLVLLVLVSFINVNALGRNQFVMDDANLLSVDTENYILEYSNYLRDEVGVDFVVMTIDVENIDLDQYTTQLYDYYHVSNKGILTLGEKQDGNISNTSPIVIGKANYGLKTSGTFNFYDGIIKGISDAISGSIADQEPNTQIINGTETIDGQTYKTVHLESQ